MRSILVWYFHTCDTSQDTRTLYPRLIFHLDVLVFHHGYFLRYQWLDLNTKEVSGEQ